MKAGARVQETTTHRFGIGERVSWRGPDGFAAVKPNVAEIVRHLPPLGSDLQYRIKSVEGSREHVATERELSAVSGTAADTAGWATEAATTTKTPRLASKRS